MLPDEQRLELLECCNALADGGITPERQAWLERLLRESESARREFVRFQALQTSLAELAGDPQAEAAPVRKTNWTSHPAVRIGAAAAMFLLLFLVGRTLWPKIPNPQELMADQGAARDDDAVALLSAAQDSQWSGATLTAGDALAAGQKIELTSGWAEVIFDCGAKLLLEGPAALDIVSAWEAALRGGTLRATVPEEAVGFRVTSPEVEIVDLGTEFSLVTDAQGDSEVFVHRGEIQVAAKNTRNPAAPKKAILKEKQARRFARGGVVEVADAEAKFQRLAQRKTLPKTPPPVWSGHWSFDATDPSPSLAGFGKAPLLHSEGKLGRSLKFEASQAARLALPSFAPVPARSAAFWLKIPADAPLADAAPILSWKTAAGRAFEAAWNQDPSLGPLGALSLRLGTQTILGSTNLRDGRWHHIAIVLLKKTREHHHKEDLSVKIYVDGRLEAKSPKPTSRKPREADSSVPEIVLLGKAFHQDDDAAFLGEIDELHLCIGMFTQHQVRQLMLRNSLSD